MTVSYVKAYFNSSDPARNDVAYHQRCHHPQRKSTVCQIPKLSQGGLPDPNNGDFGETFFFTEQKDMSVGQVGYKLPWYAKSGGGGAAAGKKPSSRSSRVMKRADKESDGVTALKAGTPSVC